MTSRQRRALALVSSGALEHLVAIGADHCLVPSQESEGAFYVASTHDCSCPDSKYHPDLVCKHQLAVRLQRVLDAAEQEH